MKERLMGEMILQACVGRGVDVSVLSDGWLIELRKGAAVHRILGTEFGMNDQSAAAIAKDKVATSELLMAAGVRHVTHDLIRSHDTPVDTAKLRTMLLHSSIVIKPLEGSHGHLVKRVDSTDMALAAIDGSGVSSWAASPHHDVALETRLVVVDGRLRLAHHKTDPVVRDGLRLFNLHAGARAVPLDIHEVPEAATELALRATSALGLRMAAVDVIATNHGQQMVLEVNAAFSLNRFARTSDSAYRMTEAFYDQLIADLFD